MTYINYYTPGLTDALAYNGNRKRLLIVTNTPPLPANIGNRVVLHKFIDHCLRLGFDIDLVIQNPHYDDEMTGNHVKENYGERVCVIETFPPPYASLKELARREKIKLFAKKPVFMGLLKPLGFRIYCLGNRFHPYRYCGNETLDCAMELLENRKYEAVIFNYLNFTRIVEEFGKEKMPKSAVITIDAHSRIDIQGFESDIKTGHKACSQGDEREALNRSDVVVAISRYEKEYFRKIGVKSRIVRCEIDMYEEFENVVVSPKAFDRKKIFFASSANQLNKAGLKAFLEEVWPLILQKAPEAKFVIAGHVSRFVPPETRNVEIKGTLSQEEMQSEMFDSTISINPVFQGTGLKIKSVMAICAGMPMVSVPCGVEGLEDLDNKAFLTANSWKEFAEACIELMSNRSLWDRLKTTAKQEAKKRFSSEAVYREFDEAMGWRT